MNTCNRATAFIGALLSFLAMIPASAGDGAGPRSDNPYLNAIGMVHDGRETFRHDTFGNEDFWGGKLGLHRVIAGEGNGDIGPRSRPGYAEARRATVLPAVTRSARSAARQFRSRRRHRTAPLKGLWTHGTGGYYHDGRFATLDDVVDHYDDFQGLGLNASQKRDLVEYLKSL